LRSGVREKCTDTSGSYVTGKEKGKSPKVVKSRLVQGCGRRKKVSSRACHLALSQRRNEEIVIVGVRGVPFKKKEGVRLVGARGNS